jgi:hypothetical protein
MTKFLSNINIFCTVFFVVEAVLKLIGLRRQYFDDRFGSCASVMSVALVLAPTTGGRSSL